jgi:hypothetical protein
VCLQNAEGEGEDLSGSGTRERFVGLPLAGRPPPGDKRRPYNRESLTASATSNTSLKTRPS